MDLSPQVFFKVEEKMFYDKRKILLLIATFLILLFVGVTVYLAQQRTRPLTPGAQTAAVPSGSSAEEEFKVPSYFSSYEPYFIFPEEGEVTPTPQPGQKSPQEITTKATDLKELNVRLPSMQMYQSDVFTGSATVQYSIEALPGRGGLSPNIALTYSSGAVESIRMGDQWAWRHSGSLSTDAGDIGLGWSLSGIGRIQRDQVTGLWHLSLNGSSFELMETGRKKLSDGRIEAYYRTNPESFIKIVHVRPRYGFNSRDSELSQLDGTDADIESGKYKDRGNDESIPGYIPYRDFAKLVTYHIGTNDDNEQWYVWDKSGTKYTFGLGEGDSYSDSYFVRPNCWGGVEPWCEKDEETDEGNPYFKLYYYFPLKEISDLHNNSVEFSYTSEYKDIKECLYPVPEDEDKREYPRKTRIKEISYNNGGAKITFETAGRADNDNDSEWKKEDYQYVHKKDDPCIQNIWSDKRIGEIQVLFQNQLVRRYRINPTNVHLKREKYNDKGNYQRLGKFLAVDSIELIDGSSPGNTFDINSRFEYAPFMDTTRQYTPDGLLLKKASNVKKQDPDSAQSVFASVEYEYRPVDGDNRDCFRIYHAYDEHSLGGGTCYRSVKTETVSYNDAGTISTLKTGYEYPEGSLAKSSSVISQGELGCDEYTGPDKDQCIKPIPRGDQIVNFEFMGHPQAKVIKYKKNGTDIELSTAYTYFMGQKYSGQRSFFEKGEWKTVNVDYFSFYPFHSQVKQGVVKDSQNKMKSVSQSINRIFKFGGYTNPTELKAVVYDQELNVADWRELEGRDTRHGLLFTYPSESLSCSFDGQKGVGSRSVSYANKNLQLDEAGRSAQYGNINTATSYYVPGCTFDESNNTISFVGSPEPYTTSRSYYRVFDQPESEKYVSRSLGTSSFVCKQGVNSVIPIDGKGLNCDGAKRISETWNIYDSYSGVNRYPWDNLELDKNELSLAVSFYTFPEAESGDFKPWTNDDNNPSWKTIEQTFTYDQYGHVLTSSTYSNSNYGELVSDGTVAGWNWTRATGPRTTTTTYYNNGLLGPYVKTVRNALGHTATTTYDFQLVGRGNLGLPVQVVDANGAMSVTAYDSFGRVLRSCSPTEQVNGECPDDKATVKYQYFYGDSNRGAPFVVETARRDDSISGAPLSGCTCQNADVTRDGRVNLFDLTRVGVCFGLTPNDNDDRGQSCALADVTKDGIINDNDLNCISNLYDSTCPVISGPSYFYSWSFYNGVGQLIQAQTEKQGNNAKVTVVDNAYNGQGLVEKQSLPYEETNGGSLKPARLADRITQYQYDSLGRKTKDINADRTEVNYAYITQEGDFGPAQAPNRHFVASISEVVNAKNQLKRSYSDPLGRLVQVEENMTVGNENNKYLTTYQYDSRGLLTDIYDTKNQKATPDYKTHITYNQAGQKTAIDDPDLGVWGYEYDPLGNIYRTTDPRGIVKIMSYDGLNRPSMRSYELSPNAGEEARKVAGSNTYASFVYDYCSQGKGRLCRLDYGKWKGPGTDQNALQIDNFTYDIKGRTIAQKKTLVKNDPTDGGEYLPLDSNTVDFVTETEYDTMDRPRIVRYPDQEKEQVVYNYNDAGQLYEVVGKNKYLANVLYNELGLPTEEHYGNNSKAIYKYWGEDQNDPANKLNYRLKLIEVARGQDFPRNNANCSNSSNENELLKICYDYDPIGNIASQTYPQMAWAAAGDITQGSSKNRLVQYSYDVLNRLRGSAVKLADGTRDDTFGTSYTYDQVGNLLSKCEGNELVEPSYVLNDPNYPVHAPQTVNVGPARGVCTDALAAQTAGGTYEEGAATQAQGFRFFGLEKLAGIVLSFLQTLKNLALPE